MNSNKITKRVAYKVEIPKAKHVLQSKDLSAVLSHRQRRGREQYLVRWKAEAGAATPEVVCSWHSLDELARALHLVQRYLEARKPSEIASTSALPSLLPTKSRKRKSPDSDPVTSRDERFASLTLAASSDLSSREASVVGTSSSSEPADDEPTVYNGVLERREGWIVGRKSNLPHVSRVDATTLPTVSMREEAARTPVNQAERAIRDAFYNKIRHVPYLSLENRVDSSTPSLDFKFVKDYVLGEGVNRADPETYEGCQKPCRPNMGQFIGCEYPRLCTCLEYAAVNEHVLEKEEPERFQQYVKQKAANMYIDTSNMPKRFPYHKAKGDNMPQTLQAFYRESRHPIYECNVNCKCGPVCKSRVVQKGRKVPLTIFKTPNRGWGLFCGEDLIQGEFVDTYLGEVITNEEADRRESQAGTKDKASYFYSLDKFVGDDADLTPDTCYVVDGQYMGGPTRFINHSCEPNCRQFTVSYNKHDLWIYDLAFFAIEDIPKGTELTFDYMDKDEAEEDDEIRAREEAANPNDLDKIRCNCGSRRCRGYLWV